MTLKRTMHVANSDNSAFEINQLMNIVNEKDTAILRLEQKCSELEKTPVGQKDELIKSLQLRCAALEAESRIRPRTHVKHRGDSN